MSEETYRFGRYTLDASRRELRADGQPLPVRARAFAVLLALLRAGGEVCPRELLFEQAWPGRVVLDDNLKVQVMALRKLLGAEVIVTVPGQGYRLGVDVSRAGDAAAQRSADAAAQRLFGRDAELAALLAALQPGQLVSVVGSAGVGKTRLALAAAAGAALPDGHAVVELGALAEPQTVVPAVARALALPATDSAAALCTALAPLSLLLVLDNAEHLLDAVASLVIELRGAAPRLALLVTSQQPLGVAGEVVQRLAGLPCGDAAGGDAPNPALALLAARAAAADAGFSLDGHAAAAAAICRQLEGIPLAIELAAARLPLLGVDGVLQRLREPLALLTRGASDAPARQQTLRAAIGWSHGLLDADERAAFRRLAVMAGSFDAVGAQRLLALPGVDPVFDEWRALDLLQSLLARSLVVPLAARGGSRRFRLLDSTRQFALEQLDAAGERQALSRRHAEVVQQGFAERDARFVHEPMLGWVEQGHHELPNLRAAMAWALGADGDAELAAALAGAAGTFISAAGLDADARAWLGALAPRIDPRWPLRTRAMFWFACANRGVDPTFDWRRTHEAAQTGVALALELGDAALAHRALSLQFQNGLRLGDADGAQRLVERMRALEGDDWTPMQRWVRRRSEARLLALAGDWAGFVDQLSGEIRWMAETGDDARAWQSSHNVALALVTLGRPGDAVRTMQPVVASIRARGLLRTHWPEVAMLALASIEAGDADPAVVAEAVQLMRGAGALTWMVWHLAEWLLQCRRRADAARLAGWATKVMAERGEVPGAHAEAARARVQRGLAEGDDAALQPGWRQQGERWIDDDVARMLLAAAAPP